MLLLLLTTVLTSFAQTVKVSMEDFDIAPGEQRVVDINVTNDVMVLTSEEISTCQQD